MAASKNFPNPFGGIASRYRAYRRKLPALVSGIAANDFRKNFRRQGVEVTKGNVEKWKPRRGKSDKGRALLIKSGRLRRGIRPSPTYDYARVVNAVPYAAIHNRGGAIKGQARAYATNLRSGLVKLRSSGHGATMPARPYMVTTQPLMDTIGKTILDGLQPVFNP